MEAVNPLLIYVGLLVVMLAASLLVWVFRHTPSRRCPLCEAQVEIGRTRCQTCGYRFSTARM
jgi:hypothetical protein